MMVHESLIKEVNIPELLKSLRICAKAERDYECVGCAYTGYNCNDLLKLDAAAAIDALQAELDQWKAAVKGQEDGIKVLQAEVERLQADVEAAYALMEVQDVQSND